MKTKLLILSLLPTMAMAQSVGADVDAELDQLYASPQATHATTQQTVAPVSATQPIYILNQATPNQQQGQITAQNAVQKQPTTLIEASPLNESRADMMRKARMDAEGQTETRIVEKLEQSRMEDERRRANVLFGDKFSQLDGSQQQQAPVQQAQPAVQQQQIQPVVVPVQVVPAQPAAEKEEKENTRDIIREELQAAMSTEADAPAQPLEQRYFGGMLGIGQYTDVSNVTGNYSLGFAFGTKFDDAYAVEGSFIYSQYTIDGRWGGYDQFGQYSIAQRYQDVNQYAGAIALKYYFFSGMVKPVMGGVVQYSYREYKDSDKNRYSNTNNGGITSHAVDVGGILGADIELSARTSIGVDFRYMFNMNNRKNYPNNVYATAGDDLENHSYYVMGVTGKVNF